MRMRENSPILDKPEGESRLRGAGGRSGDRKELRIQQEYLPEHCEVTLMEKTET